MKRSSQPVEGRPHRGLSTTPTGCAAIRVASCCRGWRSCCSCSLRWPASASTCGNWWYTSQKVQRAAGRRRARGRAVHAREPQLEHPERNVDGDRRRQAERLRDHLGERRARAEGEPTGGHCLRHGQQLLHVAVGSSDDDDHTIGHLRVQRARADGQPRRTHLQRPRQRWYRQGVVQHRCARCRQTHRRSLRGLRKLLQSTYKCTGSINDEYLDTTYIYTVDVPSVPGGGVDIQAYDPEFAVGTRTATTSG